MLALAGLHLLWAGLPPVRSQEISARADTAAARTDFWVLAAWALSPAVLEMLETAEKDLAAVKGRGARARGWLARAEAHAVPLAHWDIACWDMMLAGGCL